MPVTNSLWITYDEVFSLCRKIVVNLAYFAVLSLYSQDAFAYILIRYIRAYGKLTTMCFFVVSQISLVKKANLRRYDDNSLLFT